MSFMPMVLFLLGVIILIGAWRLGNPSNTSPELIAALKGVAGVKREISYIRTELRETEARIEEHEKLIQEREVLNQKTAELVQTENEQIKETITNIKTQEYMQKQSFAPWVEERQVQPYELQVEKDAEKEAEVESENPPKSNPRVFPDKYRWVIELHEQGWSTLEIAGHLAISQDAVNMILKTYPRGGQI
ncbi:DUF6115 domain-containing protein [Desulfitobacterium sp. AusDCA]|uniref:DUF6115 domain-containing protein n=1 Tax=Desulfitobacterium sp. AusDCA TaxID=3240383 RepID=UPI003DA70167